MVISIFEKKSAENVAILDEQKPKVSVKGLTTYRIEYNKRKFWIPVLKSGTVEAGPENGLVFLFSEKKKVGSAAIKQGRSANRKHTYFFFGLTLYLESIGMVCVISKLFYKGTILQKSYKKMTISYNSFVKFHG